VGSNNQEPAICGHPLAYYQQGVGSDPDLPEVSGENRSSRHPALERRRAERSNNPLILMLLDAHQENGTAKRILA